MPPKRNHNRSKTRSKEVAANDAMADCTLPPQIMLCILTRLPVKSLLRFKTVCKPWCKLFATPSFIKSHYAQFSALPENRSFMIYSSPTKGRNHHTMSLLRIESDEEKPTKLEHPYPQFFFEMDFVGSCNGLICMAVPPYGKMIHLWNPALKLATILPLSKLKFGANESVSLGFAYDEEAADFKVVRFGCLGGKKFRAGVEVYSTKSNSWKTIKTSLKFRSLTTKSDAVVNGNPYWIANVNENVSDKSHIVWFDVKKMALRMLPSLNLDLERAGAVLPLVEWKGSLASVVCKELDGGLGGVNVLVFDEKQMTWDLKHSFGPIEMERMYRPLQCSKSGKIIGSVCLDEKLFVFDPETGRVKGIEVEKGQMLSFKIHEYSESLVRLDGMKAVEMVMVGEEDDAEYMEFAESFKAYMQLRGGFGNSLIA